jgi:hypothetical protein
VSDSTSWDWRAITDEFAPPQQSAISRTDPGYVTAADARRFSQEHPTWKIFPAVVRSGQRGKLEKIPAPGLGNWRLAASSDPARVEQLWEAHHAEGLHPELDGKAVIAIACAESELVVLDTDVYPVDAGWWDVITSGGKTHARWSVSGRGPHFFFAPPPGLVELPGNWDHGEIKYNGYVVVSGHPLYWDAPVQPLPRELFERAARSSRSYGSIGSGFTEMNQHELDAWLDTSPSGVVIDESGEFIRRRVSQFKDKCDLGARGRTSRREAMRDLIWNLAVEGEAGAFPLREAFEASYDAYSAAREWTPDDGMTAAAEVDHRRMWGGAAGKVSSPALDEEIEEHRRRLGTSTASSDALDALREAVRESVQEISGGERAEAPGATMPDPPAAKEGVIPVKEREGEPADPVRETLEEIARIRARAGTDGRGGGGSRVEPVLGDDALEGPIGEYIRAVEPLTEASVPAILAGVLAFYSTMIGPWTHHALPGTGSLSTPTPFIVVGASSFARKSTSLDVARVPFEHVNSIDARAAGALPVPVGMQTGGGIASGPALVKTLADMPEHDRRLVIVETEFGHVITIMNGRDSTFSQTYRKAFDRRKLSNTTKTAGVDEVPEGEYWLGMIGHITEAELKLSLAARDIHSGTVNRMLWFHSPAFSKRVLEAPAIPVPVRERCATMLGLSSKMPAGAKGSAPMSFSDDALKELSRALDRLEIPFANPVVDSLRARVRTHIFALSMTYARSWARSWVEPEDVRSAVAAVEYSLDTVNFLWGDRSGDDDIDAMLKLIDDEDDGLISGEDMKELFGSRYLDVFRRAQKLGFVERVKTRVHSAGKAGRPPFVYFRL